MKSIICLLVFLLISSLGLKAQDMQYSQYYANPLYMNPAFAGTGDNTRLMASFRNQWPNLQGKYISYAAGADHYFPHLSSGVGVYLNHDRVATARIASTELGMMYNYNMKLSDEWNLRPAIQVNLVSRNTNFSNLTFNEQYNSNGLTGANNTEQLGSAQNVNYADISTGGMVHNENLWLGLSLHHLNRPNQSVLEGKSKLPTKISLQGGYKFNMTPYDPYAERMGTLKEVSFTPTFMYKAQGKFDQLDLGAYFYYEPILVGLWYRGLPLVKKSLNKGINHDALVFMAGIKANGYSFGYSYDMTISSLGMNSGGAHEISFIYEFRWGKYVDKHKGRQARIKAPKSIQRMPSPHL